MAADSSEAATALTSSRYDADEPATEFAVVQNWVEELKRLAPTK